MTSGPFYSSDEAYKRIIEAHTQSGTGTNSSSALQQVYNHLNSMTSPNYTPQYVLPEEIVEEPKFDGNCKICWAPLAGKKRNADNPEECADCAGL